LGLEFKVFIVNFKLCFEVDKCELENLARPGAVFSRANIYISFRRPVTLNLNKVSNVHGHFIDLSRVILLNISENPDVIVLDKVDRHTLPPESS